jgi:hypothetical protein
MIAVFGQVGSRHFRWRRVATRRQGHEWISRYRDCLRDWWGAHQIADGTDGQVITEHEARTWRRRDGWWAFDAGTGTGPAPRACTACSASLPLHPEDGDWPPVVLDEQCSGCRGAQ